MSHSVVIGLGQTGISCARYLTGKGEHFAIADTRFNPPGLAEFEREFPGVELWLGPLDAGQLCEATRLIVSPGIAVSEPAIAKAMASGVPVVGDVELFAYEVSAPVVAITGSNAKSTVTSLVGYMAEKAGINVGVGGNIGLPVLDLLTGGEKELYVLELSSFQLETTHSLRAQAATILNLSADHLDRYPDMLEYGLAKQRVYTGCKLAVVNRGEHATLPVHEFKSDLVSFGLDVPEAGQFGLISIDDRQWLSQGENALIPVDDIALSGRHGQLNALSALALGQGAGIPMDAMLEALKDFQGLDHRCQLVLEHDGVKYINDSKGTNVGATVAALNGLAVDGHIILIAGGDGKGAEFDDLAAPIAEYCKAVVLIGRDANVIAESLTPSTSVYRAVSMEDAVKKAHGLAVSGDQVLLSPACASWDMFGSYIVRGDAFTTAVKEICCAG
ncbi:UDP-N-acetylmuramoyl-L-alanine--D-glutamate ligase [Oceanospirillum linum]|uniref:UDP-N-acetylmuramoylalanine--D-glutamate ligase n=1 Tax=Oceanospirillum linum TaxID=966 RepID=A0A1T1HFD6_OCELI|nr:UDP-N-acetylmuramoyl-L-alanine--D-glutamate ligase [Oceanospirillum linum]OOV88427.1 UDP-N-acetylmuramoyl-L-alanine--D-glutamate ligase [Oceanospirillum linum]SEF56008.1 UDP-N-acetylmuramoylalanine--D-glutamate ligase [Oleiphilus messinensis]SMP05376.1 UDP-N-acetylmuramoylalanine--D-glutamate ligase [Oceanospirillum linum]